MEYIGDNYERDMAIMSADPKTLEWWKITALLQKRAPEAVGEEWWHTIHEVFHMD
jgi:L-rhamnose mutarotase